MSATIDEYNEATVSEVNSNEVSIDMYNLAQALSEGYVQGLDYINPSLRHKFQRLADSCLKEVIGE